MSSKTEKDKTKQLQDKCQSVLNGLLRDEDNKYCVDCDSKGPRWASWNIGVFLCIRCAGIHRNLGVHISKVKSVNLDSWTPEQVVSLQQMGNSRARAVYEANLPDNFRRPQNDLNLETFIRAKYEHKKYIAREWVPPALPKVNWEKEIDEEIEKQKRKKKSHIDKKILATVEVPQLPKPKNPSPKPNRVIATPPSSSAQNDNKTNKENDLLGLQNGDDSFSGFLSATTISNATANKSGDGQKVEEAPATAVDVSKSEEESFFNQTIPTEKEKVKMTKDSILALYGSAPPVNNLNQFQNQMPYQQGNFQGQNPVAFQSFGGYPQAPQQPNFPAPNAPMGQFSNIGVGAAAASQQWGPTGHQTQFGMSQTGQMNQFALGNQFPNGPTNQFQNGTNQFANFQNAAQFPPTSVGALPQQQQQFGQFAPQGFNPSSQTTTTSTPNPFFANQNSLQQQFGNLSLANQNAAKPAPTLATNIWQ